MFGGLFSRTVDETVTSIAEFDLVDQMPVMYTFSRDSKLRTWSSVSGHCLKTMDVRTPSTQALVQGTPTMQQLPEATTSLIRVVPHPSPNPRVSHIVVVFVPTPFASNSAGIFVFYRGNNGAHHANDLVYAAELPASSDTAGWNLRGFEIEPPLRTDSKDGWRLWTAWDDQGTFVAESVPVNHILQFTTYLEPSFESDLVFSWQRAAYDSEVDRLDAPYFDNILGLEAPEPTEPYNNSDIAATFIDHLFFPGRFSQLNLEAALDDYIDQLPQAKQDQLLLNIYPSLSSKFEAAVGSQLRMETSPQTGAPIVDQFRKQLKLEWLGIWARVRELDKQGRWPVGTASMNGQVLILDREGGSVPVQEDTPGVLVDLGAHTDKATRFQALPEGALLPQYAPLAPPQSRRCLTALAVAGNDLATALQAQEPHPHLVQEEARTPLDDVISYASAERNSALDAFAAAFDEVLGQGASMPVENLAGALWDDMVEPYITDGQREAVQRALSESSDITRTLSEALDILATPPPPISGGKEAERWSFSGFGNALLSSAVANVLQARYVLARNVLLVSLWHLATSPDPSAEDDESEALIEVLARAQATYHRYSVGRWVSEQTGEEAAEASRVRRAARKDDVLAEFDGLRMRDTPGGDGDYDTAYSLLHSLLASELAQAPPADTLAGLFDAASAFVASLDLLSPDQIDVEPEAADVKLAYAVLSDGHPRAAVELTERYPLSSGMAFVRGRALLERGDQEGVRYLELAAQGCRDGSLACILPACTSPNALGEYYRRALAIADEHGLDSAVAHFGTLAISHMPDSDTRALYTRVFLAHLAQGEYEAAYSVLTSAPHHDIKRDLLGQLISGMCEAGQVGRLTRLGFIGFQRDVEERLTFKARNSDPLKAPNYYRVLYSWHIARGDYRSAAEIMYAQGQRFASLLASSSGRISPYSLSAMQAQSYLAAINALALVDKRNAWISVLTDTPQRTSSNIPKEEFEDGTGPVDIVTLQDMRAEYATVLGQLKLTGANPNLVDAAVTLSAAELVGLFTQRAQFDDAFSTAAASGTDMTDIFVAVAERCVDLEQRPNASVDGYNSSEAWLAASPITARLRGSPSALAQRYLQTSLSRHDTAKTGYRYTSSVADVFFANARSMPAWLASAEMARDAESFISRALAAGWTREALGWASELLGGLTPPDLLPKRDAAADAPYNLLDRVTAAAKQAEEAEIKKAAEEMKSQIGKRVEGLKAIKA